MRVAKKWLVANSVEVIPSSVVIEHLPPNTVPERNPTTLQKTPSTASSPSSSGSAVAKFNTKGPIPGLYRNGKMIRSEADMFDHASSDEVVAEESSGEEGLDADSEELIVFKPRGRR